MTIYRRGPDKWHVVVQHRGKRLDRKVRGTKADAEAYRARLLGELEAGDPIETRAVPTLRDFTGAAGAYLRHAQMKLAPSTARNRGYQIASLVDFLGDLRLNEIHPENVEAYQRSRLRDGIRPATVNDDVKVLIAILNFARQGRRLPVPVPRFEAVPVRGKRRNAEPWSREEVDRLLRVCAQGNGLPESDPKHVAADLAVLPILVFLLNTGCRKGEALALEWENVDFRRGLVRIWASEDWQPKDADNREVPMNAVLRGWLERLERDRRGKWVFPVTKGKRRGERFRFWPQKRFDAIREGADLTGGPHRCRHTYASHFLEACPDLFLLGRILGHSHSRVTELYGHLLPDSMGRAASAVSFAAPIGPAELAARERWDRRK